ncbi:MAG: hypothetical protein NT154_13145, partial [Verrucomicrobia bacterium]|nr:hypothetical protein [Verrucomicrobiota bacterium]
MGVINQNPQPVTRYAGEALTLNVTLTSGTSPQYQWWQGGTTMIPGATNSSLTLPAATGTAGSYTVVISNSENAVTSTPPAVVTVNPVTSITTALSSHWTFDETSGTTAADSTANALTATLNNFPGDTTTWVPGQIGGALAFDGASQQYANVTGFVQATNTLTLSAWVWASTRTDRMSIVDSYGQNSIGQFRFGVSSAALRPLTGLVVQQSGTAAGNPDVNPIPVGVWEHVALVADGTTVRLYLNGTQVATAAYNGTIKNPSGVANMFIGARIADDGVSLNGTKGYWSGKMDDLGMWTRGLTSAEILAIYAAGYVGHQDLTQADAYKPASPFITAQPQGTTAYAGASQYLRLSVSASGTQPLCYQWWRGASPVAGATNATYLVNGVTTNDAGSYTVVVSDVVSAVTSTPPAVVTVITPPATGYSATVVADVPEGYWRMDDSNTTLVDMMGRHNGTYLGSTYVQGQPGGIFGDANTCADFEAGTDYASVPYSPFINGLGNTDSFSLELWVTSHAPGSGGTCPIQIKGLNGVNGINIIAVEDSSAYMQTAYANNGSWGSIPVTGGAVKNDGVTWQHIAITFDRAASTMSIYVNGVLAGSATANYGPACSPGTDLQIGAGGGTPWMGQVDEVAWYNKALSADRILAHYVVGTATVAPTITTQPQDTTAYASASFVLSVAATG